jgi:hypothetical protein
MQTVIRDGVETHYELKGTSGTPVPFIQGFGIPGAGWAPQMEYREE